MSGVTKTPLIEIPIENYSFDDLKDKTEIVFLGMMELGWELQRWSPPVNYFIKTNPDKKFIIATLENRIDLYKGYQDHYPIKIDGIYKTKIPTMYTIHNMHSELDSIYDVIQAKYPNAIIKKAPTNRQGRNVFDNKGKDFDFQPRPKNKQIIDKLIFKNNKPLVVVASRHREDNAKMTKRNWSHWNKLYSLLKDFTIFIAGTGESYIRPQSNQRHCICLEDYNTEGTSTIGLVIESMKASGLTVGQQSGNPILSLQLGIHTIMWGHEKVRHEGHKENPQGTKCDFLYAENYDDITPEEIYKKILEAKNML